MVASPPSQTDWVLFIKRIVSLTLRRPPLHTHTLGEGWAENPPRAAPGIRVSPSVRPGALSMTAHFGARVRVTEALTSYKIAACQIRPLEQSAIRAPTCSWRKLTLTAMGGANETSKCERCPENGRLHVCVRTCVQGGGGSARTAGRAAGRPVDTCR